jgi:hypothetical protein
VDVVSVSAVLYIINLVNCYQNGPQKSRKEAKEGRDGKESSHNRKIRRKLCRNMRVGGSERIMGISIVSDGKNSLDLRAT